MADLVQYYGTGRRKASVARVFLRPGEGKFTVNHKGFEEYFVTEQQRVSAKRPLVLVGQPATFNLTYTNHGLIEANDLKVIVPNDPDFIITQDLCEVCALDLADR